MLTNMFVGRPEGNYDRLLDVSRAVTGTLFFVPSQPVLDAIGAGEGLTGPDQLADAPDPVTVAGTAAPELNLNGSLQIGSLRGEAQR